MTILVIINYEDYMLCKCSLPVHATFPSVLTDVHQCQDKLLTAATSSRGGGGGGGGSHVQRGAAPALRISRKKGSSFKTSACLRFCKRRVLFCTQDRSMGVKIPLQSTKYTQLCRRVTPDVTGLPSLLTATCCR